MARPRRRALPAAFERASRFGDRDHPWLPALVAGRTCLSLFHTQECEHGLLEPSGSLAEQDGADAEQDGADARPHGARRLSVRRLPWLRTAFERQPRLRRIPYGDVAAAGGRAAGI